MRSGGQGRKEQKQPFRPLSRGINQQWGEAEAGSPGQKWWQEGADLGSRVRWKVAWENFPGTAWPHTCSTFHIHVPCLGAWGWHVCHIVCSKVSRNSLVPTVTLLSGFKPQLGKGRGFASGLMCSKGNNVSMENKVGKYNMKINPGSVNTTLASVSSENTVKSVLQTWCSPRTAEPGPLENKVFGKTAEGLGFNLFGFRVNLRCSGWCPYEEGTQGKEAMKMKAKTRGISP